MATECGVFAGIHTARSGGTTQTPCFVRSVITPLDANSSWSSGCECSGITWRLSKSADTLAISPSSRPFAACSMLWHLCDISCHDIESNRTPQVLFLLVGQAFLPVPLSKSSISQKPVKSITGGNQCSHQERWSASSPQKTTTKRERFTKVSSNSNS